MKKLNLLLITAILFTFLPINVAAETVDVGVTITGELVIDVVTTINTSVKLDVAKKKTIPVYMHAENHGNALVAYKIVDIEAVGVDSPSTFVAYGQTGPVEGKNWSTLTAAETKQYIAFGISKTGSSEDYISIMPDQELVLGTMSYPMTEAPEEMMGDSGGAPYQNNNYAIDINSGYMWEGTTSLSYKITTLVELAATSIINIPNSSKQPQLFNDIIWIDTELANYEDVSYDASDLWSKLMPSVKQGAIIPSINLNATLVAEAASTVFNNQNVYFKGEITSPSGVTTRVMMNGAVDEVIPFDHSNGRLEIIKYLDKFDGGTTDPIVLSELGYYYLKVTITIGDGTENGDYHSYARIFAFKVIAA